MKRIKRNEEIAAKQGKKEIKIEYLRSENCVVSKYSV